MFKILNIIFFLVLIFINKSYADIVKEIRILNNERITKETILVFSDIKIGVNYNANDLDKVIKDLYKTNFFSNVSIDFSNGILTIDVEENKIIQSIVINGIKKKELVEILKKQLLLKDKNPFVENFVTNDIERIQKILKNSGYYFSKVSDQIIENNNNTVDVIYNIDLGEKVIKAIEFIGDKFYKDRLLRNIIVSEEDKFLSLLPTKVLNPENIQLDKRLLKNYFLNRGHYQVSIDDSLVEFTENNNFKLVYNITAGPKFTISKVNLCYQLIITLTILKN